MPDEILDETVVRLAAPDYNFVFKKIPPIQFLLNMEDRLDPARLRTALDEVLEDYWILRGRLEIDDRHDAVIRVPPHRRDAIPVRVAETDRPIDSTFVESGFEHIDEAARGPGGPLATVRIEQAPTSTCIGISVAHAAGDGRSLFEFVDAWARAYSGKSYDIPSFDRDALRIEADPERPTEREVERATGYLYGAAEYPPAGAVVRDRLRYSAAEVAALRQDAHAKGLTVNDVLTARSWRTYAPYAPRRDADTVALRCPVDYRRHLPELAPEFYGSVLRDAVMEMSVEDFDAASMDQLAQVVHRGVRTIDAAAVADLLQCYERLRRTEGPEAFARLFAPGLIVTNFSRTKVTDLDFDGVQPDYVLNLSLSTRTANIVPQRDGLEVQILRRVDPLHEHG